MKRKYEAKYEESNGELFFSTRAKLFLVVSLRARSELAVKVLKVGTIGKILPRTLDREIYAL